MKKFFLSNIQRIIKHELISGSALLFIGTTGANFIAFIFNFILVRAITPAEYGIFASLVSLITLLSVPNQFLVTAITQFATEFIAKKEMAKAHVFYQSMYKSLLIMSAFVFLIFCLSLGVLQSFLHISNVFVLVVTGLILAFSYLSVINAAFLQSLLRFGYSAVSQIIGSSVKLLIGGIFLLLGWQSGAGIMAVFGSFFGVFIFTQIPFVKYLKKSDEKVSLPIKEIVFYSLPAFFTVFSLASFTTTDVLLAKHFLSSHDAGIYAGLSLIGRVIFYFTAPITAAMFPIIVKRHATQEKFRHIFLSALGIVGIIAACCVFAYTLFPQLIITVFLGGKMYIHYAQDLWTFGLYAGIFSVLSIVVNFFLSTKHTRVVYFVTSAALLQIMLLFFYHSTILTILWTSLGISTGLLCTLLVYYWYVYER